MLLGIKGLGTRKPPNKGHEIPSCECMSRTPGRRFLTWSGARGLTVQCGSLLETYV